jgi:hypothetical protein
MASLQEATAKAQKGAKMASFSERRKKCVFLRRWQKLPPSQKRQLDEGRKNCALRRSVKVNTMDDELKRLLDYTPSSGDPLTRWRQEAAQAEAKAAADEQALRETERQMRETPAAWDAWFVAQLRRHLGDHMQPSFDGVAEGVGTLIAELRHRLDANDKLIGEQRELIHSLQLECARLAIKVAELKTDQVLAAMPGVTPQRGVVN